MRNRSGNREANPNITTNSTTPQPPAEKSTSKVRILKEDCVTTSNQGPGHKERKVSYECLYESGREPEDDEEAVHVVREVQQQPPSDYSGSRDRDSPREESPREDKPKQKHKHKGKHKERKNKQPESSRHEHGQDRHEKQHKQTKRKSSPSRSPTQRQVSPTARETPQLETEQRGQKNGRNKGLVKARWINNYHRYNEERKKEQLQQLQLQDGNGPPGFGDNGNQKHSNKSSRRPSSPQNNLRHPVKLLSIAAPPHCCNQSCTSTLVRPGKYGEGTPPKLTNTNHTTDARAAAAAAAAPQAGVSTSLSYRAGEITAKLQSVLKSMGQA
eukprot:Sro10_g008290.1 n/a (328) ;mRNA; r:189167-190150